MKYTKKLFVCSSILIAAFSGIFSGTKVDAMGSFRKSPFISSFENISDEDIKSFYSSLSASLKSKEKIALPKFTRVFEFSPEVVCESEIDRNFISFNRCHSCTIAL